MFQSATIYKLLANLAKQQSPPKDINELTLDEIVAFIKEQFGPRRFVVRERFKFWSDMNCKPGETLQELAARIQDATTCTFTSIRNWCVANVGQCSELKLVNLGSKYLGAQV